MSQLTPAQQKMNAIKGALEKVRPSLAALAPKRLPPERLIKSALVAAARNPEILACEPKSVALAVLQAAQLGLDCSGLLGQGYIVPFYNRQKQSKEAVFIAGYRGLLQLCWRSGEVESIAAHVVYSTDPKFVIEYGDNPSVAHIPDLTGEGGREIVGAYMIAYLKNSPRPFIEWMPRAEIERVRAKSANPNSPMWTEHYAEACRKTVLRRGLKYLPITVDDAVQTALAIEEQADAGDTPTVLDGEIEVGPVDIPGEGGSQAASVAKQIAAGRGRRQKVEEPAEPPQQQAVDPAPQPTAPPPAREAGYPLFPTETPWGDFEKFKDRVVKIEGDIDMRKGRGAGSDARLRALKKRNLAFIRDIPVADRQEFIDEMLSDLEEAL